MKNKLPKDFYVGEKVERLAPLFLGKILTTRIGGELRAGKIVEVEAYCGVRDRACHAYFGRTKRNEIMFGPGGRAYVYLCYGIHRLFNIVVEEQGRPCAVLIRALEPVEGVELMEKARGFPRRQRDLANGPGKLSQAMGIQMEHHGLSLTGEEIWLEEGTRTDGQNIMAGPRIGIDYAGEDKHLPWRFALDSPYAGNLKNMAALAQGGV